MNVEMGMTKLFQKDRMEPIIRFISHMSRERGERRENTETDGIFKFWRCSRRVFARNGRLCKKKTFYFRGCKVS